MRRVAAYRQYFYPRPPRGGRPRVVGGEVAVTQISIHALREEGDLIATGAQNGADKFLSTPSARRATMDTVPSATSVRFLSTPSARRATVRLRRARPLIGEDFYPRPPRGGRRLQVVELAPHDLISIHALREEGDAGQSGLMLLSQNFYPRPPRGGRQQKQRQNLYFQTNYTTFCTNLEEL